LAGNLSSISAALKASLPEKAAARQYEFCRQNPHEKNSVKNYMSAKVGWAMGFINSLDAFVRHSLIG